MPETKSKKGSKKTMAIEIKMEEGVNADFNGGFLSVKGKKGEAKKKFLSEDIGIEIKDGKIMLTSKKNGKRQKKVIESFKAHIKNLLKGTSEGHKYVLKICSGHFPMSISANKEELTIKNFLGEKVPRKLRIKEGATVKVEGDQIIVESFSKETAGQVSADIEQLTRRPGYDSRIFQDGCFIISKDGIELK